MAAFPSIATPQYPISESVYVPKVKTEFESGHVQSRKRGTKYPRRFRLIWDGLSSNDFESIVTFFKSTDDTFTWTHPFTSVVYTVRFTDDELSSRLQEGNEYSVSLNLEES